MNTEQISNKLEQLETNYKNEIDKIYVILKNIINEKDNQISKLQEQISKLKSELDDPMIIVAKTDTKTYSFPKSSVEIDISDYEQEINPSTWGQFPYLKNVKVKYFNIFMSGCDTGQRFYLSK